ncbi:aminoacetone oxidase family FAD-binding enzyme [Acinetobacter sp. ANC 4558]|uniref:TIGR03862 family flavoprotein n=1 Tax=Acinetobacter sp. ANC 4558 TaxID=1977876 RepID=UPI000A33CAF3|nr:TIGR03862 family flavoprotein [Acinetobacter sp. ANC 4558]OTG80410.1 aminoacetone oxidase family FAD-binding enzyme [Acinetobacter sp. ANC 4558]
MTKRIAIIGAGPAGLMAAEVLSQYDYHVHIYEQKPSAARKFLMAGKTGLNISHSEPFETFIQRYDQREWLEPWVQQCDALWIQNWMKGLGVESYIGSSGRVFPIEMKAAPLLRSWLKRLAEHGVQFHYRHRVIDILGTQLSIQNVMNEHIDQIHFDAIILACGAVSWPSLGSDGLWQKWLNRDEIEPFQASNVGVERHWSKFMQPVFGEPLKRVEAWVSDGAKTMGDIVITHYGLESGLIYKQGRALRQQKKNRQPLQLILDLLPDQNREQLTQKLQPSQRQSLNNVWRKAGLDHAKANLVRELVAKEFWYQPNILAQKIKHLEIDLTGFRSIEEAISCAGGVRREYLTEHLQLKNHSKIFVCGEMLDWDAPTGGYLLTACFATGRAAGEGVHQCLLSHQ